MRQSGQFVRTYAMSKADNVIIAGVHLHESTRILCNGRFVIGQVGLVRCTDFANYAAAVLNNLGNTEKSTDLHKFAPGNDDFLPRHKRIQDKHDRCGVVVDNKDVFGPREPAQHTCQMAVP